MKPNKEKKLDQDRLRNDKVMPYLFGKLESVTRSSNAVGFKFHDKIMIMLLLDANTIEDDFFNSEVIPMRKALNLINFH